MLAPHHKTANDTLLQWLLLLTMGLALGFSPPCASGQVDTNINKSVWKMLYGVTDTQINSAAWLAADDDGDGLSNGAELVAGTNPFKPNSTLVVATVTSNSTTVSMTFQTMSQKLYTAQATASINPLNWQPVAGVSALGDGTSKTLVVPKSAGSFFRVVVQDQATASDQVSDWAKQILGYTPGSPLSSQSIYDHVSLANVLASQNVVTVAATDPSTTQPNTNIAVSSGFGTFTITRSGYFLFGQITVNLNLGGTAVPGVDYVGLPSTITFPAGVKTQTVAVTPLYNPARTTSATASLTVSGSAGFSVGNPATAVVTVYPADLSYGTGLAGLYYTGSSSTYASTSNLGGITGTYSYNSLSTSSPVTITAANPALVTWTAHGLVAGAPVVFSTTGTLPTGLTAGTTYHVISTGLTANAFEVSATVGGAAVSTLSGTQTGTHTASTLPSATVTYTDTTVSFAAGNFVNLAFSTGTLSTNVALPAGISGPAYDKSYVLTAANNAAKTFTVAISGTGLPASGSGNCYLSAVKAPTVTRLDPTVDFTWGFGVPSSGAGTLPTSTNNNWVGRFDSYLVVPTTGSYYFQVQADDGASVYLDSDNSGSFEAGEKIIDAWTPGSSTFTPAATATPVTLTAGIRYHIRVEYLQLNGNAAVSLQWKKPGDASFSNIPGANTFQASTGSALGWTNQYWSNTSFVGLPRFADYPASLNLSWGTSVPSQTLPAADNFSVRWEGYVSSFNGGTYNFSSMADDGAIVYIDLNQNGTFDGGAETALTTSGGTGASGNVVLVAGQRYKIRVDYIETSRSALVNVSWKRQADTVYSLFNASAVQTLDNLTIFRDSGATNTVGWWASYYFNSTLTDPPLYSAQDTSSTSLCGGTSPVTVSIANPAVISWAAHGLAANTPVVFSTTGTLPTGLTAGTTYFVMAAGMTANSFQVSTTSGSATPVTTSGSQGGTQTATTAGSPVYTYGTGKPANSNLGSGGSGNDNWGSRFDAYIKEPGTAGSYPATYSFQTCVQPGSPLAAPGDFARLLIDGGEVIANNSGTIKSPVSITVASPAVITWNGHNLSPNMPVVFGSTGTLPTGLTAGTTYFVISAGLTANAFEVSTSVGGSALNTTVAGTGTYSAAAGASSLGSVSLTSGQIVHVVFEHSNLSGNANPALYWKKPADTTFTLVPAANLFKDAAATAPGVTASYFTNTTFYGVASFTNYLAQISLAATAGLPSQVINSTNFSARWETYLRPSFGGPISFDIQAAAGARVFLDLDQSGTFGAGEQLVFYSDLANTVVVDPWVAGTATATPVHTANYNLVAGQRYKLRVEFYDSTTASVAKLRWLGDGASSTSMAGIPNTNLYLDSTTPQLGVLSTYYTNTTLTDPPSYSVAENANPGITYDFGSGRPAVVPQSTVAISIASPAVVTWNSHGLTAGTPVVFTTTGALPSGLTASSTTYYVIAAGLAANSFEISTTPGGSAVNTSGTQSGVQSAATIGFDNFSVRWAGQVMPQYSETYTFDGRVDDGVRIWVNNQLVVNRWPGGGVTDSVGTIALQAGVRYDIVMEYYEGSSAAEAHLYWYSNSQVKQIIPTARLFPTLTGRSPWTVATTTIGGGTAGSSTIIVGDTTGINVGETVTGSNIPAGATVVGVDSTTGTITLSTNLGSAVTAGTNLSFTTPAALPAITSPSSAVALMGSGSPFTYTITASNGGGNFTATGLPPGIVLSGGVLSGTPTAAGNYQVTLTATNTAGTTTSILNLQVLNTAANCTRELWTGLAGTNISDLQNKIQAGIAPSSTDTVTALEDATAYANSTGERLRGYFTAPVTGNYYFWIAASNTAELWIADSSEAVTKLRRAYVTAPGSGSRTWNTQGNQQSPWLSLIAGQQYYFEVLHNTGTSGASSHLSVAWFVDPTGTTNYPLTNGGGAGAASSGGIVPAYALSPWNNPPTTTTPGTIYLTTLSAVNGLTGITATGGAYIRLNGTTGIVHLNYSGLSSGATFRRIYKANGNSPILLFDLDAQDRNYPTSETSDSGYTWTGVDINSLSNGLVYLSIGTTNNPGGEVAGTFGKVAGSQSAPTLPSYTSPFWTENDTDPAANSRFLTQATFGPSPSDLAYVQANGYRAWIEDQFSLSATHTVPYILGNISSDGTDPYGGNLIFNAWWRNAVTAPDQLRQRIAFALSEILVVSYVGPLDQNGRAVADYYDTLLDNGFDSFRNILKQVTLTPAMGYYLNMQGNPAGSIATGLHPNENYAREIMQLFSIGLYKLWPDGTLMLDSNGNPIPTYNQDVITGMARVFTGWNWGQALNGIRLPTNFGPAANYLDPMVLVSTSHELGTKILLDNVMIPGATVISQADTSHDPNPNPITIQTTDPVLGAGNLVTTSITSSYDLNGLRDLETALDSIANNSAVGPVICRQLIQRLVTSNPTPEYLYRVVRAFNGERNIDGIATGVRGDMKDTIRAILLDPEARSATQAASTGFGKQREPLLRVTGPARAFFATGLAGCTYRESGGQNILITTPTAHRLSNSDTVYLNSFADVGNGGSTSNLPTTGGYSVGNTTFTYTYVPSTHIVTVPAPAYLVNDVVNLQFTTGVLGNASFYNGSHTYKVLTATAASATSGSFTVDIANNVDGSGTHTPPATTISGITAGNPCTITTPTAHNLINGTSITISGVTGGTFSPVSPGINSTYTATVISATQFTIPLNCTSTSGINFGSASFTYTSTGTVLTPNNFTVSNNSISTSTYSTPTANNVVIPINVNDITGTLASGHQIFVSFSTGPLAGGTNDGVYTIASATASTFTITVSGAAAGSNGNVLIPRFSAGYNVTTLGNISTIRLETNNAFDVAQGDPVWIDFLVTAAPLPAQSKLYNVSSISIVPGVSSNNLNVFSVTTTPAITNTSLQSTGTFVYPLLDKTHNIAWNRSGTCRLDFGTLTMGQTDGSITQTPLFSQTVFNFFYPDYRYPGAIAAAGMTTPEFQLTNDSNIVNLTNVITNGLLTGSGNTYGYSSFTNGGGVVVMDLGPYLNSTLDSTLPTLVSNLYTLLTGGTISVPVRDTIKNYVQANFNAPISSFGTGNPCTVNTSTPHNLTSGTSVTISGVNAAGTFSTPINGTFVITVTSPTAFTLAGENCTSTSGISYTNAVYTATALPDTVKRDRVRSVLQLILTSAEYSIQK